ncbi:MULTISPECIES: hypothetical protein [unclassified Streptomyces]|uniref:hypothetical protein n=1 Tax=unclassified Streptomyces TaxID=2593676 RepID=UPI0022B6E852|nr:MULTISPECIES: hypothetical protein [unclassified Streptomyces]MCZ7417493.1 hypothetical protein [Streptomyces sp. WMMC897]MCZ7432678.1 hypothetical protein [Streptomyces sp. WMMC1477]
MSIGGDGYGGEREYADTRRTGTRVRLPEGESREPGRSPGVRPGRSLVTVVGVVVILIAAIAFATRGGGESEDDAEGGAQANPTAPSGVAPVEPRGPGVPSGFPRTEQGAQSAAANYVVALTGDGMYDTRTRTSIVDAVFAPDLSAEQLASLDDVYSDPDFLRRIGLNEDGSAPEGSTFVSRANPIGSDIVAYDGSGGTATVAVWYVTLFGISGEDSRNPVTEAWYTNTFELRWADGDWKVVELEQQDGPTPVGRDQRASSAEEMAEAQKRFGGFTYAR